LEVANEVYLVWSATGHADIGIFGFKTWLIDNYYLTQDTKNSNARLIAEGAHCSWGLTPAGQTPV
jgi:hypothetical protein